MGVVANVGFAQVDYLCRLVKQLDKSIPNPFAGTATTPVSWKNQGVHSGAGLKTPAGS